MESYSSNPTNLGSIWAATIIHRAKEEEVAYLGEINETHELDIQATYIEYVQSVLEMCTYFADEKDHGLDITTQNLWEVIDTMETRSGLGLPWSKYKLWKSFCPKRNSRKNIQPDHTIHNQPLQLPPNHPLNELRDFLNEQENLHSECVYRINPNVEFISPIQELRQISISDYRTTLINYTDKLIQLIDLFPNPPSCRDVVKEIYEDKLGKFQGERVFTKLTDTEEISIYRHAREQITKQKIFPGPLEEQGNFFDKPVSYLAWCIASSTSDKNEVDELIDMMQKFGQLYFQKIKTFIDTNEEVLDKKRRWLRAIAKARKAPENLTAWGMLKDLFR